MPLVSFSGGNSVYLTATSSRSGAVLEKLFDQQERISQYIEWIGMVQMQAYIFNIHIEIVA